MTSSYNAEIEKRQVSQKFEKLYVKLFTFPVPVPDEERELTKFLFSLLCVASKSFMKVLKAFIKPFEAPQRSAKIKI